MTKKSKQQKGAGLYDRSVNYWFPSNPIRDGERHAVLKTPAGWMAASYMGPGTDLISKLRQGVLPVTKSDKVAMSHDTNYSLAKNHADIRAADIKMVNKLKELAATGQDSSFNIYMGMLPIQAKMKLEDWGVVSDKAFTTYGEQNSKEDTELLEKTRAQLQQEGYGRKKKAKRAKPKAKAKPKKALKKAKE